VRHICSKEGLPNKCLVGFFPDGFDGQNLPYSSSPHSYKPRKGKGRKKETQTTATVILPAILSGPQRMTQCYVMSCDLAVNINRHLSFVVKCFESLVPMEKEKQSTAQTLHIMTMTSINITAVLSFITAIDIS
jgi:hypothetical protein